jgi:hypothetical protein
MEAHTISKDFQNAADPREHFVYDDISDLGVLRRYHVS